MKIFRGIESFEALGATSVTVGSFDGVHLGHLSLLDKLTSTAKANGHQSVVVSFSPHPRVALGRGDSLSLLTSDREKALLLEAVGVDALLLIEFNEAFSALSFEEFIVEHLVRRVGMSELVMGFNHRLGHNHGGYDDISALGKVNGFEVVKCDEYTREESKISSTVIRKLITDGDMVQANTMLIKPYLVVGESDVRGVLILDEPLKLLPPKGCYSALINGELSTIEVDEQGVLKCNICSKYLEINILKRE